MQLCNFPMNYLSMRIFNKNIQVYSISMIKFDLEITFHFFVHEFKS